MQSAKRTRCRVPLIAAAVLFVPAVGAGVFVGRKIPERRPAAITTSVGTGTSHWQRQDRTTLDSCQEKLAALTKPRATVANADASPGEAERDAAQPPATIEGLNAELRRCTKSEIVTSAEVCVAAARQFEALMALPKDGLRCGRKSRAADLIEENFERCGAFADMQADVRPDDLTKEQASVIAEATRVRKTLTEEELLRRLKEFVYTCTGVTPMLPPGLGEPLKRRWPKEPPERKGVNFIQEGGGIGETLGRGGETSLPTIAALNRELPWKGVLEVQPDLHHGEL